MSTRTRALVQATGAMGLAGAAALGWSLAETHLFRLRFATAPILPDGAEPLRVLHLSDLHMTPSQGDKKRWVAGLGRLEPDFVVGTGDFLSDRLAVPHVIDALRPLLDRPGVFTLGSNDYLAPRALNPFKYFSGPSQLREVRNVLPWPDLVAGLTDAGWIDLDNRRGVLDLGSAKVDMRGVDDPHIGLDRYDEVAGPFDVSAPIRLGVTHAPYLRVLDAMVGDGANLVLAGHTHGGQLRVPGLGPLVTNCDLDRKRARGLSEHSVSLDSSAAGMRGAGERRAALHVSAGLGTSPYAPIRFACPPEATLLTLVGRT